MTQVSFERTCLVFLMHLLLQDTGKAVGHVRSGGGGELFKTADQFI